MRKKLAGLAAASTLAFSGIAAPAAMAQQNGLVNVSIGNINILRNVDVAVAANVIAGVCAGVDANAAILATQTVDETGQDFVCNQRGTGRVVAVTDA
jgi:hypothetical protein